MPCRANTDTHAANTIRHITRSRLAESHAYTDQVARHSIVQVFDRHTGLSRCAYVYHVYTRAHDGASTSFLTASLLSRTRTSWSGSGRVQAAGSPQRQISLQWSNKSSDRFFVQASIGAGLANGSSLHHRHRTGHAIRAAKFSRSQIVNLSAYIDRGLGVPCQQRLPRVGPGVGMTSLLTGGAVTRTMCRSRRSLRRMRQMLQLSWRPKVGVACVGVFVGGCRCSRECNAGHGRACKRQTVRAAAMPQQCRHHDGASCQNRAACRVSLYTRNRRSV